MNQTQFLLFDHQHPIRLQAERMSLYRQGEIIEAFDENNEVYYVFFYKNTFLTALKATRLRRRSYIEHAFKKGLVFHSPHPLINALLSSDNPLRMTSFKALLKKLDMLYTPHENAFILTFFESFIPKKELFKHIQSMYYQYRRNGQMFAGYQVIRILMDFSPNHSFVTQLAGDIKFNKYKDLYDQLSEKLFDKDLIFAEKALYLQKESDKGFQQLIAHLENESRWIDVIAMYLHKIPVTLSTDYYHSLIKLLEQHLNENETVEILEKLSGKLPSFQPLQEDLFNKYLNLHKIKEALHIMKNLKSKLSVSQTHSIESMVENLDSGSIQPEEFNILLRPLFESLPETTENLLEKCIIELLKNHEIIYIQEWLKPLKEVREGLKIYEKIDKMEKLINDLDQLQTCGELYYEFRNFDKAIECFSWETELKPTSPKPVQWLSKIYREMGLDLEADTYQQHFITLQKQA